MKTLAWLIFWGAIAFIGMTVIRKDATVSTRLDQPIDKLLRQHQEEIISLEQELKRAAREADARRKTELDQAWGGALAATFKNPAYSIGEALQEAAMLCAPSNTIVRADVQRFTEFAVTFESGSELSTNEMVMAARKLAPVGKAYLNAVRFSAKGKLYGELDRSDIEFIEDWTRAPDSRIAMLLPRESQSRVAQDANAIERLRDEQRISQALSAEPALRDKVDNANRQFREAMEEAYTNLTSAFDSIQKAVALHELRSLRGLDEREKHLRAATEQAERAQKFWSRPPEHWQRVLEGEGISGELRDLLVKTFPAIFRYDAGKTEKLFEALRGEIESVRVILQMLTQNSDKWRFSSEGIVFREERFADRFEAAQRQFREDLQQTDAAVRAWREAVGP